ncbi:glycoside hydrolase family 130 protein [Lutimonas halocynthiae]|uniref:glycoside hydrolase family 130 protein n=1 Tax=Lutimonas halocynthiae TaxID=1446477 RepID=UPI0025B31047|nr:glycoside hydrolase family 130 protein [Lutimonas halocynthiae]MDN3642546.1 glycoside hydrolase family 130 protein [Lutimonas halocynthiae]
MQKVIIYYLLVLLVISCNKKETINDPIVDHDPSWTLDGFVKQDAVNPILEPSDTLHFVCPIDKKEVKWEERNVLNPSAIVKDDKVFLFYRAQDAKGTSRIGLAISDDGLHFKKNSNPVFYPKEDEMQSLEWNYMKLNGESLDQDCVSCYFDGAEDPRIIESEDGTYIMTYTAYDGKTARLALASSTDLINWKKHGLVMKDASFKDFWSKAGAIIVEQQGNKMIAVKIDGYYWMYFGDTNLYMAYSKDLINWELAINNENDQMIKVLHPRQGYFDSRLVEPGPFALMTEKGVLLIYNASNALNFNDPDLPQYTYAAGQALFDADMPYKLIDRTDDYFIFPDKDYELVGEVNNVCFVEGMVFFKNKWFLYYGTGDSKIAVAVSESLELVNK